VQEEAGEAEVWVDFEKMEADEEGEMRPG